MCGIYYLILRERERERDFGLINIDREIQYIFHTYIHIRLIYIIVGIAHTFRALYLILRERERERERDFGLISIDKTLSQYIYI